MRSKENCAGTNILSGVPENEGPGKTRSLRLWNLGALSHRGPKFNSEEVTNLFGRLANVRLAQFRWGPRLSSFAMQGGQ